MRSLLAAERVILNFLQHLGGVATQTQRFVRRVAGTGAKIYDTRKTIPGLRLLDKYAVRCGGGFNHRIGLYDGLLVKDNHLAHVPVRELAAFLSKVIAAQPGRGRRIDSWRVEVDHLEQLQEVLKVDGRYVVLLDNMDCPRMEQAVQMRDAAGKRGTVDAGGQRRRDAGDRPPDRGDGHRPDRRGGVDALLAGPGRGAGRRGAVTAATW